MADPGSTDHRRAGAQRQPLRGIGGRLSFYPDGNVILKAIAYAPVQQGGPNGPPERRVESARIKAPGARATPMVSKAIRGDNKLSILYHTDFEAANSVLAAERKHESIQLAVRRSGESFETVLAGPVALDPAESHQLAECMQELIALMQSSVDKGAASAVRK